MRIRILLLLALAACNDDEVEKREAPDASADATVSPSSDCSPNPQSYLEIINACTDAEKVIKNPTLPLVRADGTLPPLP